MFQFLELVESRRERVRTSLGLRHYFGCATPSEMSMPTLVPVRHRPNLLRCPSVSISQTQRFPTPVRRPAAVNSQGLAIDETAFDGVGKKCNSSGDVIRCREASHRHAPDDVGVAVSATTLVGHVHLGFHPTRTNGIDAHSSPSPLGGKSPRETDQAVLRRVIGCPIRNT